MANKERTMLAHRIIDHGDGTATYEIQLDGAGIFALSGAIRKEAWQAGVDGSHLEPVEPNDTSQGVNTAPLSKSPVAAPAPAKEKHKP